MRIQKSRDNRDNLLLGFCFSKRAAIKLKNLASDMLLVCHEVIFVNYAFFYLPFRMKSRDIAVIESV